MLKSAEKGPDGFIQGYFRSKSVSYSFNYDQMNRVRLQSTREVFVGRMKITENVFVITLFCF